MSTSPQINQIEKIFLSFKVIYLYCILKIGKFVHSYPLRTRIVLAILLMAPFPIYFISVDHSNIKIFNIYLYWVINAFMIFMIAYGNSWVARKITESLIKKMSVDETREQNIKNLTLETVAKIEQKKLLDTIPPVPSSNIPMNKKVHKI